MPSSLISIVFLGLAAHASAHLSFLAVYGSNNLVGHGFGVNLQGKYPRSGTGGDAGGDSTIFETGTDNPSPACGRSPELGELDIPAWLNQAEGFGLPAAYSNMSVVADAFQVNRDGGGPMSCQYNEDATATSWKDMTISLNQAGNDGILDVVRENSTVVINFPSDAKCTGGFTGTACIVRCRTGVNKRFGGCFAVKLSDSVSTYASADSVAASNVASTSQSSTSSAVLTDSELTILAEKIIADMKLQGLLIASTDASSSSNPTISTSNSTAAPAIRLTTPPTAENYTTSSPASTPIVTASSAPKTTKHTATKHKARKNSHSSSTKKRSCRTNQ